MDSLAQTTQPKPRGALLREAHAEIMVKQGIRAAVEWVTSLPKEDWLALMEARREKQ